MSGAPLTVGAGIGVAVFAGRDAPADLLRRADGAMYAAKRDPWRPAGADAPPAASGMRRVRRGAAAGPPPLRGRH